MFVYRVALMRVVGTQIGNALNNVAGVYLHNFH